MNVAKLPTTSRGTNWLRCGRCVLGDAPFAPLDRTKKRTVIIFSKWTVLVGRGFAKAFRLGGQAVKVDFNACYNAIRPKAGNETWLLGVKLTFQLPN